jgi:formyl-CoA transferase
MFDAMADWMSVPLMQQEGGLPPTRVGLAHPSIAPYGVFKSRDGVDLLISIQSDREWRALASQVLDDKGLAGDPAFATNVERIKRRSQTDARVAAAFAASDAAVLIDRLTAADIAFARVNDPASLAQHPQLTRIEVTTPSGSVRHPASAVRYDGARRSYRPVPALGQHGEGIRAELLRAASRVGG